MNHQPVATAPHFYSYTHHLPHHSHQQHYHDPGLVSLAYRPLLQQTQQHPAAAADQQQPQQQQQQLAAAGFAHPHFRHPQAVSYRTRQQSRHAIAMDSFSPQGTTDEELAELQKLSNEYEPEVTGPLVGQRQPSTAITTEYASADPVFQAKTAALPQKYSSYRTVRGDGKCGWRAVAFGYFETLIYLGDGNKFLEEETRLRSLSNVCNAAGFDVMLFEDFADETFELLRKVATAVQTGTAEDVILEAFNDETLQNYVITHLKTLTAAWMKTRPQEYAPWLLGQTVEEYCNGQVMPTGSEIDNVGLSALKDVFLSPAGITLEVIYLDRSEGGEVNMHRFSPVNPGVFDIGTVRLLYRPGHYDLLYTPLDLPPEPAPAAVPTYLQYESQPHHEPAYDIGVSDFMTLIPGMSYANPHQSWISNSGYAGSDFFTPTQQCTQPAPTPSAPAPQPQMQLQPVYVPATPTTLVPPPAQMPQDLAIRTVSHATMPPHPSLQHQLGGPFRPSHWELKPDFIDASCHMPYQTAIFKNSHFNTAHFMNPAFQPEEWRPDDDYVTTSCKTTRHRSSA